MGLFDGIGMMVDIVKTGISAVKASGKLDELTERSQNEFKGRLNPEETRLYQEYVALVGAKSLESDTEKQNAMTEKVEAAEVKYLAALGEDASLPQDFRNEITAAIAEYARANGDNAFDGIVEKYVMKKAKTPEEKAAARLMIEGGKALNKLEKLAARSQDEFKSLVKPAQAKLYQDYQTAAAAQDKEKNQDKKNALQEQKEEALMKCLDAIAADAAFPQDFRNEITSAQAEYKRINDAMEALDSK